MPWVCGSTGSLEVLETENVGQFYMGVSEVRGRESYYYLGVYFGGPLFS